MTSDVKSSAISQPTVARECRSSSPSWSLMHPRPISQVPRKTFWVAGRSEIPCYSCSPWKFYEPFVELKPDLFLVLCNGRTEVRVISIFLVEQYGKGPWFPEFQHPSFVDIYEVYDVNDEVFAVYEYLDFSLQDLLRHSICLAEPEIAFIMSRVLAGICFIWSRELNHQLISFQNIRLSQKGEVKIDHTSLLEDGENTSADPSTLGTLMLQLMTESKETLARTGAERWSAEAINFVEATFTASPFELSDHIFIARSSDPKTLTALCSMSNLIIDREPRLMGVFSKMWEGPSPRRISARLTPKKSSSPPKLKAPESRFVPQEMCSPEEPPLDSLPLRRASPWQYYTKAYRRELGASVVVACKKPATFELFAVKCIAGSEPNDKVQNLRQVRHENFLSYHEIFVCDNAVFTVSECMAISLTDLNGSATLPNEIQIATIIHQVLTGLDFLASRDMMHGDITCSTILLSLRGDVKIANPEGYINIGLRSHGLHEDTEALGFVMLQLMERGSPLRGRLALEHADKWSHQAGKFLQLTASSSAKELLSHAFLDNSPRKEELVSLVGCAQISSHIPFCLEGP